MDMKPILPFMSPDAVWKRSPLGELPVVPKAATDVARHFCVVAGGLALIISRCSPEGIARHYPKSNFLYGLLRNELGRGSEVTANAHLLSDVMHEIAEHADPSTRASLRFCFDQRRLFERAVGCTTSSNPAVHENRPPDVVRTTTPPSRLDSLRAMLETQKNGRSVV